MNIVSSMCSLCLLGLLLAQAQAAASSLGRQLRMLEEGRWLQRAALEAETLACEGRRAFSLAAPVRGHAPLAVSCHPLASKTAAVALLECRSATVKQKNWVFLCSHAGEDRQND